MKVVAFIREYASVDRIIRHLKLTFAAEKPPPSQVFEQIALMTAEESGEYCSVLLFLTTVRRRRYHHFVMGGLGSEPYALGSRAPRKKEFPIRSRAQVGEEEKLV
jgi:hypothetical protein